MIYHLRRKFVVIAAASVGIVLALVFAGFVCVGKLQLDTSMDMLADLLSANDGSFPDPEASVASDRAFEEGAPPVTPDTQMSTRFFSVHLDGSGRVIDANVENISSVSEADAGDYAERAVSQGGERGWIGSYRYKITVGDKGTLAVFVNGESSISTTNRLVSSALLVLVACFALILLLIVLLSKWVVRPVAESYEKQRQFVTDANHELKTPLTLILSNVDIVESELGKSEWLDDIRSEGERMGALVNQLGTLSRMDEDDASLTVTEFDLSSMALEAIDEFAALAADKDSDLTAHVEAGLRYRGDEEQVRRLMCILLDNAVKYCDEGGDVLFEVRSRGRGALIIVENSYADVGNTELGRLFDRFYRSDRARTYSGGFGIGLSIAQGIARNHRGDIKAYEKDPSRIGFKATLR